MDLAIQEIRIGKRYRKELGDLDGLKGSIQEVGLLHPVVISEGRALVAGRRRVEACKQLGWSRIPVHVVSLNDPLRGEFHENAVRKAFTPSERVTIARALEPLEQESAKKRKGHGGPRSGKLPEGSTGEVGEKLAVAVGIGRRTLEKAREVVEAAEADPECFGSMQEKMDETGNVDRAYRSVQKEKRIKDRTAMAKANHPLSGEAYQLQCSDVDEVVKYVKEGSVDAIVTDPPYGEEVVQRCSALGKLARVVLKPGGHCLVMLGQAHLPEALMALTEQLTYQWTLAYLTPGASTRIFGRKVLSNWKPVVWLTNGKGDFEFVSDVLTSPERDKQYHDWGQSEGGMRELIERFTVPKALVLDPFCGGGSTGEAALRLGRLFVGTDSDETAMLSLPQGFKGLHAKRN